MLVFQHLLMQKLLSNSICTVLTHRNIA